MNIVHNTELSRFELGTGENQSVAEYKVKDGIWYFTHTFVPESQRGMGIAGQIMYHALITARELKKRVVAICPYVVTYLERHPEFDDLI